MNRKMTAFRLSRAKIARAALPIMVCLAVAPARSQDVNILPEVNVAGPRPADQPPPKETLLSTAGGPRRNETASSPKAGGVDRCVDVKIGDDHSLGCLNEQLKRKVDEVNPVLNLPPLDARSQDLKVGTVNVPAVQQQYGQNFGHSVIPYRPPRPVFTPTIGRR